MYVVYVVYQFLYLFSWNFFKISAQKTDVVEIVQIAQAGVQVSTNSKPISSYLGKNVVQCDVKEYRGLQTSLPYPCLHFNSLAFSSIVYQATTGICIAQNSRITEISTLLIVLLLFYQCLYDLHMKKFFRGLVVLERSDCHCYFGFGGVCRKRLVSFPQLQHLVGNYAHYCLEGCSEVLGSTLSICLPGKKHLWPN